MSSKNTLFRKRIKPFFSNKGNFGTTMKLVEKDEVMLDDREIAKELKTYKKILFPH